MPANSIDIPLGSPAPDFTLSDAAGNRVSLAEARGQRGTVIVFYANHCPFVKLIRAELVRYADEYAPRGVRLIAINSNDPKAYPAELPAKVAEEARMWSFNFPYLIDADQEVAKRYRAVCTPDIFLVDADLKLYYHGQFDDARPSSGAAVTGRDLRAATDALLADNPAPEIQRPAIGCGIKWKPGNAPAYLS